MMNDNSHRGIRRAGYIPRTLIGVNGVRLINIPGVYYPPHMLTEKTQRERHLPVILSKPPAWAISSRQAAEILGCKQSSTRELLHRERVRFCRVAEKGCPPMAYWDRRRVQALARKLRTPLTHVSPQLIASAEALAILRVSRNSLSRFVRQGLLQRFRLRVRVAEGPRLRFYYLRDEVAELDRHRQALGLKRSDDTTPPFPGSEQ